MPFNPRSKLHYIVKHHIIHHELKGAPTPQVMSADVTGQESIDRPSHPAPHNFAEPAEPPVLAEHTALAGPGHMETIGEEQAETLGPMSAEVAGVAEVLELAELDLLAECERLINEKAAAAACQPRADNLETTPLSKPELKKQSTDKNTIIKTSKLMAEPKHVEPKQKKVL